MLKFLNKLYQQNISWKVNLLSPHMDETGTVLDFGCGDFALGRALKKKFSKLKITGVDVINFKHNTNDVSFVLYNGGSLPFKNNQFDIVIAFYVFHHCPEAKVALKECMRVAKKKVIFVESTYRFSGEILFMKFLDMFYNALKFVSISPPNEFYSKLEWIKFCKIFRFKIKCIDYIKQKFLPSFFPFGISYLFELKK